MRIRRLVLLAAAADEGSDPSLYRLLREIHMESLGPFRLQPSVLCLRKRSSWSVPEHDGKANSQESHLYTPRQRVMSCETTTAFITTEFP